MNKVISLVLFGGDSAAFGSGESMAFYAGYLAAFVRAHHALFPGWELHIQIDARYMSSSLLRALLDRELITGSVIEPELLKGKCETMLRRFAPVWWTYREGADFVFARDLDALPTWRERCCVEAFMQSSCAVHTIHDNVEHAGIMGGLSGVNVVEFRKVIFAPTFKMFIKEAGYTDAQWAVHGADQHYLNTKVAPKCSVLEHSVFSPGRDKPTLFLAKVARDIAPLDDPAVPDIVKEKSDSLIPFMGCAGYNYIDAVKFYDEHGGPMMKVIREAEQRAGVSW